MQAFQQQIMLAQSAAPMPRVWQPLQQTKKKPVESTGFT
jgi:hypothetical protein